MVHFANRPEEPYAAWGRPINLNREAFCPGMSRLSFSLSAGAAHADFSSRLYV